MPQKPLPKILLVDDEPDIRLVLVLALRATLAIDVVAMATVMAAFDYLRNHTLPDIIVLDRDMPGLDGLAACQQLQASARYRDIPIVFLSACHRIEEIRESMAAGATAFLRKPFDPLTVGQQILTAVGFGERR